MDVDVHSEEATEHAETDVASVEGTFEPSAEPSHRADVAPIWLPRHEREAREHAAVTPPHRIEGWSLPTMVLTTLLGSRSKTVSRLGSVGAAACIVAMTPVLAGAGWITLSRTLLWHWWTLGLLLLATSKVRSVSLGTTVAHWLGGLFVVPLVVDLARRGLAFIPGMDDGAASQAILTITTLLVLAGVLIATTWLRRERWIQPGVGDLLVLGTALGSGFSFLENGVWQRRGGSGFGLDLGLFVPSALHEGAPENIVVAGPAVLGGLLGAAIGLLLLHRRERIAVAGAFIVTAIALFDRLALVFGWSRSPLWDGWLPIVVLLATVVAVVRVDLERLSTLDARDHLYPPASSATDPSRRAAIGRYRRLRNGVHTRVAFDGTPWPPPPDLPTAELARAASDAGVEVGRHADDLGWDLDPDDRHQRRRRFFGPHGWTSFVVDDDTIGFETPRNRELIGVSDDDGETVATTSWLDDRPLAMLTAGAMLVVGLGVAVMSDSPIVWGDLAAAPDHPPIIRTALGALGATAAMTGRARPAIAAAWEYGPPEHQEESAPCAS